MYSLMGFQPIIEAVDVGKGYFVEREDAPKHFKDVAEEVVLAFGGG